VSTRSRPPTTAGADNLRWQWPTAGRVVERFSAGDPSRKGLKIAGKPGQSIVAAEGGSVVYSGSGLVGYGQLIIVKHNNNYLSAYGHNRKLLVQQGDQVARGAQIAEMGLAGGAPVLHFEIRRDGDPVDPLALLPRR
jgi:lipoprotein NlpD